MRKVITYGTFDLFHKGHYNILKRAKEQGDYLIVGVTSESYDIERGKLSVHDDLSTRINNVKETGFADEVIIEEYQGQKIRDIQKYNIDVFVIGSDWRGKFENLKQYCEVVYLERTKNISSTIIRQSSYVMEVGIVTDNLDDASFIDEVKYVSGFHVQSVYAEREDTAKGFCDKYGLAEYYYDFADFLKKTQLIYVTTKLETRYHYIKAAIQAGVHVISDIPIAKTPEQIKELLEYAHQEKVLLFENLRTAYLRGFNQLAWMIQSNHIIGEIYNVRCSAACALPERQMLMHSLYAVFKLLGTTYEKIEKDLCIRNADGSVYEVISIKYSNCIASIEISGQENQTGRMEIIGSAGRIVVPDDWWNTRYYKHILPNKNLNRYSFNFEGNGLRYILQEVSISLRNGIYENPRLTVHESVAISRELLKLKE